MCGLFADFSMTRDSDQKLSHALRLPLPNNLFALVEEDGGGGFWICDAVGARDWRME